MSPPGPLTGFAALFLAAGILATPAAAAARSPRPQWSVVTEEAFDASAIAPYEGRHAQVYSRIDRDLDAHLEHLQRWVRQRSISAQDDGIDAMAQLVADDLRALGFQDVELVETPGHPGVFGHYDAGAERTLVVYMMYDVQPVEENWRIADPFAGELVDHELGSVLMARGATNQKGPQRAFLNAVDAIIREHGTLPVNLYVVAEGEEELGSPNFGAVIEPYLDRLRAADGAFFPMNIQMADGSVALNLGVKGIVYFELEARGGDWGGPARSEIHGSLKAMVDSPALRLVQAIASMTSADGNTILIPGYYEAVRPPSDEEQRLVNGLALRADDAAMQKAFGVSRWIDGMSGRDAILRNLFDPTLNIDGIWSGYTGEGMKTILPHVATAKIDSRLPPGLEPEAAYRMIREHLDAQGFEDIELRRLSGYPAASTPVDAPLVQAAIGVFNRYGASPRVAPWLAGSAPFYQFTRTLGLPFVFGGLGHGAGAHAPDEYMLIEPAEGVKAAGLAEIEKSYVDLLYALAEAESE
ncbi:M20/M25/M40 family metallo-hydrolase [Luteimonas sp. RD2P54]|uniref:M20/M25/M40 family metallo-hydrolase n=1 Tax=Luteimonas endophytica TaxID=3042023 RepID=A0ABT6JAR4_9GAMM|nr:M20/M25/M40 family metallo-hydrolase [Luteimonas endophytica]MDH5823917.1 M20/M25/M40 family metallo-hydrolase [Luteimonas endophytica]